MSDPMRDEPHPGRPEAAPQDRPDDHQDVVDESSDALGPPRAKALWGLVVGLVGFGIGFLVAVQVWFVTGAAAAYLGWWSQRELRDADLLAPATRRTARIASAVGWFQLIMFVLFRAKVGTAPAGT